MLPWLRLYGGLYQLPGTQGFYGRSLVACGVFALLLAIARMRGATDRWPAWHVALPTVLALWAGGLGYTRWQAVRALLADGEYVMLVPSLGPGLWVVMTGALLLLVAGGMSWLGSPAMRHSTPELTAVS